MNSAVRVVVLVVVVAAALTTTTTRVTAHPAWTSDGANGGVSGRSIHLADPVSSSFHLALMKIRI